MHSRRIRSIVSLSFASLAANFVAAQQTTRSSVDTVAIQANDASEYPSASFDGDSIAFHSTASNLVVGDSNAWVDVFVRVRSAPSTARVSVGPGGVEGNGPSSRPSISDDGLRIAFQSGAFNFDASDFNAALDIFVRDLGALSTSRVSVDSLGAAANGISENASLSPDGGYVAFQSDATNLDLAHADSNALTDVYLHDTLLATTTRISVRSLGAGAIVEGNGASVLPVIAAGGASVAFQSAANNLLASGDINGFDDVFVWDLGGAVRRISVGFGGVESNGASGSPSISADGRFVAFESAASNLIEPGLDTNGNWDVFVWDRATDTLQLASWARSAMASAAGESRYPSLSDDGRFVEFTSLAADHTWCDLNGSRDIFRRDLALHITQVCSVEFDCSPSNGSSNTALPSALSGDGHVVAFSSLANDLVPSDTNARSDVFTRDVNDEPATIAVSYCTAGTTTNLCTPQMSMTGEPSVTNRCGCTLSAVGVEGRKSGIIFYSYGSTSFVPVPWGVLSTSMLCVKAPYQKTGVTSSGGTSGACDGVLSVDWRAFKECLSGSLGGALSVGMTFDAQGWFHDPPAPKTTNLSNALRFTVTP